MTLTHTNAFGSAGHLLFPQRSKLDAFLTAEGMDEAKWRTYRTKDTILEIYAALAEAMKTGQPYTTRIDPPPAYPECSHAAQPI